MAPDPACDDKKLLSRLVAFDSTSLRSNIDIADFICNYLERPGVQITRLPSADGRKVNLLVAAGPVSEGQRGLVLSGHMDTVPPGEDGWHSHPFTLTRRGDTYIGRGTCDMKGFLALAINRLAAVDINRLHDPLVLLLTYDEEVGTLGARHFVEHWSSEVPLPRAVIIGEPTSLTAIRMHKGHLRLSVNIWGTPAHSGLPHLGRNALEAAGVAIVALTTLRRQLEGERPRFSEHFSEIPFVTLNVGRVSGGGALNVVPGHCVIDLGIRLLPGMTAAPMVERVREVLRGALGEVPFTLDVLGESPPLMVAETAPVYRMLCGHLAQQRSHSASFASDGGWLSRLGLDCILFGPGSIDFAHKPNEFVPIRELTRAGELLSSIVHQNCEVSPE